MSVCVVSDGLPHCRGGAQLRAFRHTQNLRKQVGIDSCLIVWDRSKGQCGELILPHFVHRIKLRSNDAGNLNSPFESLRWLIYHSEMAIRLVRQLYILRHEFDVLHIINAASLFSLLTVPIAHALGKSVIIEMTRRGGDDPLTLNKRSRSPEEQLFPHRPLKYRLFLQADAYVSKSDALSEDYHQSGLPESKLFQIPSGVDIEKFDSLKDDKKRALRHKLGLEVENTLVLFVGVVNQRKGVHRLIKAFWEIAPHSPETHLLIIGPMGRDPSYVHQIRDELAVSGLSHRVTFRGRVENVDEYMKAADIFVLPSSSEGFSVAILEAMSSGLAIVASNIPEISLSQIEHDREGLLVSPQSPDELAEALSLLIARPNLRAQLGKAARQKVLREFTLDAVGQQYLTLYKRVLAQKNG